MTYREGRRNDKDTHTCDFSDSVEDLQFLWIESTNIIVTVSVEDRKYRKVTISEQHAMHIAVFVSLLAKWTFTK